MLERLFGSGKNKERRKTRQDWVDYYRRKFTREVLGASYYPVSVICENCGYSVTMFIEKKVPVADIECPRCEVPLLTQKRPSERERVIYPTLSDEQIKEINRKVDEAVERIPRRGKEKVTDWIID